VTDATTETTVRGPFFVECARDYPHGADISGGVVGEPLLISGTVRDRDGEPLPGAIIDIWHSDDDGHYDVQQPDKLGGLAMRGRFTTDAQGRFWCWSIKPAAYPVPHDGPVGAMLEAQGRHPWLPAHVHDRRARAREARDPHLRRQRSLSGVVFGVKDSLVEDFTRMPPAEWMAWRHAFRPQLGASKAS